MGRLLELLELGRAGMAFAVCNRELQPTMPANERHTDRTGRDRVGVALNSRDPALHTKLDTS